MGLVNDFYSSGDIIINITGNDFGGKPKMGDMIGILNVLQYMRNKNNNQKIKFYIHDSEIQQGKEYVKLFKDFLIKYTDYLSDVKGTLNFEGFVEIWGFRELNGEYVLIKNNEEIKNKICIFPLLDAEYNGERNWSKELLQEIINDFATYDDYEKYICIADNHYLRDIDIKDFNVSLNFIDNINHIINCKYYVGGDTGFSHFVSVLDNVKRFTKYYYYDGNHGGWRSSFTSPFYTNMGKEKIIYYKK